MSTLTTHVSSGFAAEGFSGAMNAVHLTLQIHHDAREASTVFALDINQDGLARQQV
jgi:hypothetical protein